MVVLYALYEHSILSCLFCTQHMTYFENSWFILAFTTYVDVLVLICTSR